MGWSKAVVRLVMAALVAGAPGCGHGAQAQTPRRGGTAGGEASGGYRAFDAALAKGNVERATTNSKAPRVLFNNVQIFDGKADTLKPGNVLVVGNVIAKVDGAPIQAEQGTLVIDGGGRTLMPGLIDNHVHLMLNGKGLLDIEANQTWEDIALGGAAMAKMYLEEGFTTVRDMGGANGGLNRAIVAGLIEGPRVYASGAFIGGRGGHADFAAFSSTPGSDTQMARLNMAVTVNGADEVLAAARNNFRQGASQIKIMQTGGVASLFDPWQLNGMTKDEIRAAVQVASDYQSYVAAHSYTKDAILRALNLGVMTIEHGFMFDSDIAKLMKQKGAYITTNLTAFSPLLAKVSALADPRNQYKLRTAQAAFTNYIQNVKTLKPKRGYQTDCVGDAPNCRKQIAHEKYLNGEFFGNHRALVAMTSVGGEIAALSGPVVNPYPEAILGVIEEGAAADILLVDGNPLEDLRVIGASDNWFDAPDRQGVQTLRIIMKDGIIYKNTLPTN
jgi:imidazolonepropionase-like amidohydrolase